MEFTSNRTCSSLAMSSEAPELQLRKCITGCSRNGWENRTRTEQNQMDFPFLVFINKHYPVFNIVLCVSLCKKDAYDPYVVSVLALICIVKSFFFHCFKSKWCWGQINFFYSFILMEHLDPMYPVVNPIVRRLFFPEYLNHVEHTKESNYLP